ncbi:hypothetical protein LCGC14_0016630 [marine sediment metagenome]|uniref:RmlD-like substrate binding domain-containing protein n=1 Tax=marine sediment metagenome TaxID=412755 RepID=A0A0F9YG57_9ZZZZ|nr:dTDP-4-dehydrorhamnose reductase [Phycisphaerae bacterium]HDZ42371.1 dTDP-4-dehydrorhamnose reductase [Phycisphaerae bacterium]
MKLLITGAKGMLGRTLMRRLGEHDCCGTDLDDCDITRADQVDAAVASWEPDVVIHCAAMTAVDDCEMQSDLAFAVNETGSANVAAACGRHGARLIAISTDYVFAGDLDRPYLESDPTGPRTVYGASKLAGEEAIRAGCADHLICRVAWLYGPGGPSFLHTMLKLGASASELKIVDDQIGNPTSTDAVAGHVQLLLRAPVTGVAHLTCEGEATWYAFAQEIFRLADMPVPLTPCTTAEFPRPAPRPANSRLDNAALRRHDLPAMPDWRAALADFMRENPHG